MNRRSILAFLGLAPLAPVAARALPAAAPVTGPCLLSGDRVVQGALSVEGMITARRISRGTVFGEGRIVVEADEGGLVRIALRAFPLGRADIVLRRNGEQIARWPCNSSYHPLTGWCGIPSFLNLLDVPGLGTHTYEAVCTDGTVMLEAA